MKRAHSIVFLVVVLTVVAFVVVVEVEAKRCRKTSTTAEELKKCRAAAKKRKAKGKHIPAPPSSKKKDPEDKERLIVSKDGNSTESREGFEDTKLKNVNNTKIVPPRNVTEKENKKSGTGEIKNTKNKKRKGRRKDRRRRRKPVAPFWKKKDPELTKFGQEGKSFTFSCIIRGRPMPKFRWLINSKNISNELIPDKIFIKRNRLTVHNLTIRDTSYYTCIATNKVGELRYTYFLRILETVHIWAIGVSQRPQDQTLIVGDSAVFSCRSKDFPPPSVTWTRWTNYSRQFEPLLFPEDTKTPGLLVIHNITKKDIGIYTCTLDTGDNYVRLSATLTVIDDGEQLPFDPPCAMHIRREIILDHESGCRTPEPVESHYCMGTCGQSYYIPHMTVEGSTLKPFLNQTCKCCVGVIETVRPIVLDCMLGFTKVGYLAGLRGCKCQTCEIKENEENHRKRRKWF